MNKTILATASLLFATLLYSIFAILTRTIGFTIPLFFASMTRDVLAGAILLLPLFLAKRFKKVKKADWLWLCLGSLGGLFGFLGFYYAFYYLPVGTAYLIFYGGSTIAGFILGTIFFKEKIEFFEGFSLVLAILGLYFIYAIDDLSGSFLYVLLALMGGVGTAVWNTFSKKISNHYEASQLSGLDIAISGIMWLVLSLLNQETWQAPSFNMAWIASVALALLFIVTGQLMIYGFKYLDAQKGSLIMLMEIVFGSLVGLVFFRETLSTHALIGGLMIILAAALPSVKSILLRHRS